MRYKWEGEEERVSERGERVINNVFLENGCGIGLKLGRWSNSWGLRDN